MKHYTFEEVQIGLTESFTVLITDDQMKTFTGLSGDLNPMHTDAEYAKSKGYKDIVVYGMLSSLFWSTLVGMYLPGERCLLNKCDVDYRKPVYVGDLLTVIGEVVDKREGTRRIKIKGRMMNQEGVTVNTDEITVIFTS